MSLSKENSFKADFKKCVDFHGHICPGLAMGYRAAEAGLSWLNENRAGDEEIVAIAETDACGTDAVQVLTGCTFGKGNFIYKDHGKTAFIFLSRRSGEGVRFALKPDAVDLGERHRELMQKIREDSAEDHERKAFQELHLDKCREILDKPLQDLFNIQEVKVSLPPKAKIEPAKVCDVCKEAAMGSKMAEIGGKLICRGCQESESKHS